MELISKTALLNWFMTLWETNESIPTSVVIADIADSNVIDAVPVTRCRDCKFRGAEIGNEVWCNIHTEVFRADGFCDSGRPKGGEA